MLLELGADATEDRGGGAVGVLVSLVGGSGKQPGKRADRGKSSVVETVWMKAGYAL